MSTARVGFVLIGLAGLLVTAAQMSAAEEPKGKAARERAQEFVYPGAEKLGEDREGASMYQAKFTTPDTPTKVAVWYGKTLGFQGREGIAFNLGQQPGIRLSVVDDSQQPGKNAQAVGEPRPVTLHVLVKKTNDIVVVAVVSRGQDEKQTHVALTFIDNKAQ
jgi:hypothetical protein